MAYTDFKADRLMRRLQNHEQPAGGSTNTRDIMHLQIKATQKNTKQSGLHCRIS